MDLVFEKNDRKGFLRKVIVVETEENLFSDTYRRNWQNNFKIYRLRNKFPVPA
jgi:hypothetical protein